MDELIKEIRERKFAWSIEPEELVEADIGFVYIVYMARVWDHEGHSVEAPSGSGKIALGMALGGLKAMVNHGNNR